MHTTGVPEMQEPTTHESPVVHRLPSSQADPFGLFGFEQLPLEVLHVPTLWHGSLAVHTTGFAPVQTPVWQVSVWVHAFASLQDVPSGFDGFEQRPVPVSHVPAT